MLATIKGYYDGDKIVMDDNVKLAAGQQVLVTILEQKDSSQISDKKAKIHAALLRLSGALKGADITEETIREERLKKYEDFANSKLPVYTPAEALLSLSQPL